MGSIRMDAVKLRCWRCQQTVVHRHYYLRHKVYIVCLFCATVTKKEAKK